MRTDYTTERRVACYDCLGNHLISPVRILDYFQQSSHEQSEVLGVGQDFLISSELSWVLIKYHVDFFSYPACDDNVTVLTEAKSVKGFFSQRRFALFNAGGEILADAKTQWAMLDRKTGEMVRLEQISENDKYGVTGNAFPYRFKKIKKIDDVTFTDSVKVLIGDIDFNGHVNHVNYFDWALSPVATRLAKGEQVKTLDIYFKQQAFLGDVLTIRGVMTSDNTLRADIVRDDEIICENLIVLA